jgi:hypothetical protein
MAKEMDLEFQDYLAEINHQIVPANPAVALTGGITQVMIEEKDENGTYDESSIIRTDRDWKITLDWQLAGTLLESRHFNFTGQWHVQAFLEAFGEDKPNTGGKQDYDLKEVEIDVRKKDDTTGVDLPSPWDYSVSRSVNAGDVAPGLYRLAVALTYKDENGDPGPMAGFIEVPGMIQVYKPAK